MATNEALHSADDAWSPSVGMAAIAALIGGLIGFAIVQPTYPMFALKSLKEMSISASDEEVEEFNNAQKDFYGRNYAVSLAIVGACIGVCFVGMTLKTKRVPSAILAGVLGAAGAGLAGYYGGSVTGIELAWSKDQSLTTAGILNFAIWGAMAVGIALGASLLQGSAAMLVKAIIAGLIAAVMVVVANVLVFSIVFPGANLSCYVPITLAERIVWIIVASLTFGAVMAVGLKPAKPRGQEVSTEVDVAQPQA